MSRIPKDKILSTLYCASPDLQICREAKAVFTCTSPPPNRNRSTSQLKFEKFLQNNYFWTNKNSSTFLLQTFKKHLLLKKWVGWYLATKPTLSKTAKPNLSQHSTQILSRCVSSWQNLSFLCSELILEIQKRKSLILNKQNSWGNYFTYRRVQLVNDWWPIGIYLKP